MAPTPSSRRRPGAARVARLLTASLVTLCAAQPDPAGADTQSFGPGSLIIPMDACYQAAPDQPRPAACVDGKAPDDGALRAYGLVHTLLRKGQPVAVAIRPAKTGPGDADFSVTGLGGAAPVQALTRPGDSVVPFTAAATVTYRGAPFIIDSAQAAAVRALLASDPDLSPFTATAIHVAQVDFTAPVAAQLKGPPRLALFDPCNGVLGCARGGTPSSEGIPHMQAPLRRAGLDRAGDIGSFGAPGKVADVVTLDDVVLRDALVAGGYQMVFVPHYQAPTLVGATYALQEPDRTALLRLTAFVASGGFLLGQCAAIFSLEGGQDHAYRTYVAPAGIGNYLFTTPDGGFFNQLNGCYPGNQGGFGAGCTAPLAPLLPLAGQGLVQGEPASPLSQTGDFNFYDGFNVPRAANLEDAVGNWDILPALNDWKPEVVHLYRSVDSRSAENAVDLASLARLPRGQVMYLGGHTYAEPAETSTAGVRLLLNALLFGDPQLDVLEQSRSGVILSDDGKIYVGTYREASGPAAVFTRAADAATWIFPQTQGHLRQYPARRFGATETVALGARGWDWDAAALLPPAGSRRVLTQQGAGAAATLQDFSTATRTQIEGLLGVTGADADALITAVRAGALGGIDHSTPALVPGSPVVPGGTARPTVIYAGARDGQLHAVAVSGAGLIPGTELWSFLPQDQLPRLRQNTAAVDASPNVRDLFADWAGTGRRGWRTYLAAAEGAAGTSVHALDVSDPQAPVLRWQRGTAGSGVLLGNARGATWGVVSGAAGLAPELLVSTNQTTGAGLLVSALAGKDGALLWSFGTTYTRTLPGSTDVVPNDDIPGAPAVVDLNDSGAENGVFVADYEGKVWMLDAVTGRNLIAAGQPLYDVGPTPQGHTQPIGAPLAVYRDQQSRHIMVLAVTGGADWAAPGDTYGLYAIDTELIDSATGHRGKLAFQIPIDGRGYAAPTVSGNDVYLLVSYGNLSGNLGGTLGDPGAVLRVNLTSHVKTTLLTDTKGAGALGVGADGQVVGATVKDLVLVDNAGRDTSSSSLSRFQQRLAFRVWLEPL